MFDIPLHNLIIHFPIALSILAFIYDGRAQYTRRPELHDIGYGLSVWAAVTALISVVTGLQIASLGEIGKSAITGHALFGISTAIVLTAFGLWRYSVKARQEGANEDYSTIWLLLQGLAAVLAAITAVLGHKLT